MDITIGKPLMNHWIMRIGISYTLKLAFLAVELNLWGHRSFHLAVTHHLGPRCPQVGLLGSPVLYRTFSKDLERNDPQTLTVTSQTGGLWRHVSLWWVFFWWSLQYFPWLLEAVEWLDLAASGREKHCLTLLKKAHCFEVWTIVTTDPTVMSFHVWTFWRLNISSIFA